MLFRTLGVCAPLLLLAFHANADAVIDYGVTVLGGGEYQYNYSVYNDGSLGPGVPIQLFDIFFNPAFYQAGSLNIVTTDPPSSQWSELILASIGTNPADYDALALHGGIPVGGTVSGFAVRFEWIGPGLPGAQPFTISDPDTFDVVQSGQTMPEPSTFWLLSMTIPIFLAGVRGVESLAVRRVGFTSFSRRDGATITPSRPGAGRILTVT